MSSSAKSPLHQWHVANQGRMVDFAGWLMPLQYTSIVEEHRATRTAAGMFDISHMGRLQLTGRDAGAFLDRLLTRRASIIKPGEIRYALITNSQGGIIDDVLVYHLEDPRLGPFHLLVVNAGNRSKVLEWIEAQRQDEDVTITDRTTETAMIAVQGPRALATLADLVDADPNALRYYTGRVTKICGYEGIASRTGYTGEDGCELMVPATAACDLWQRLLSAGAPHALVPAGLGARDTLRLEAGMPLYGHELNENVNPFQAGLDFAVRLGRTFIGSQALETIKNSPQPLRRVGLTLSSRRVPREHYRVLMGDNVVGEITSGTFSPTLERPIAMAYVQPAAAAVGTQLAVDIRGRLEAASVVALPFYRRTAREGSNGQT